MTVSSSAMEITTSRYHRRMKRVLCIVTAALAWVATLTLNVGAATASPAQRRAYTTPSYRGNGGYADIASNYVTLFACDTYGDWRRVVVTFQVGNRYVEIEDADGANNGCKNVTVYVPDGTPIWAQAFTQDGGSTASRDHWGTWTHLGYS